MVTKCFSYLCVCCCPVITCAFDDMCLHWLCRLTCGFLNIPFESYPQEYADGFWDFWYALRCFCLGQMISDCLWVWFMIYHLRNGTDALKNVGRLRGERVVSFNQRVGGIHCLCLWIVRCCCQTCCCFKSAAAAAVTAFMLLLCGRCVCCSISANMFKCSTTFFKMAFLKGMPKFFPFRFLSKLHCLAAALHFTLTRSWDRS